MAPVEVIASRPEVSGGTPQQGGDAHHEEKGRSRGPLPRQQRPHQGEEAGQRDYREYPAEVEADELEVVAGGSKEHLSRGRSRPPR